MILDLRQPERKSIQSKDTLCLERKGPRDGVPFQKILGGQAPGGTIEGPVRLGSCDGSRLTLLDRINANRFQNKAASSLGRLSSYPAKRSTLYLFINAVFRFENSQGRL